MNFSCRTGFLLTALAALGLAAALPAQAEVIVFDDITNDGTGFDVTPVPNGYHGFNWYNFDVSNTPAFTGFYGPNGYVNGTVSPPNVAFNGYGYDASFLNFLRSGAPSPPIAKPFPTFTLKSADFTAAWYDGLTIRVQGVDRGFRLIDYTSFTVNTTGPTLETFNWSGLDGLFFSASGGTIHPSYHYGGTNFALDNLTVTPDTAVSPSPAPEPAQTASLVFVGLGLGGVVLMGRRKKALNLA